MWHDVGTVGVNPSRVLESEKPKMTETNVLASQSPWIFKDAIVVPVVDEQRRYHLVELVQYAWRRHDALALKMAPGSHLYRLRWWTAAVMETLRWAGGDEGVQVLEDDELVVNGIGDVQMREEAKGKRKGYKSRDGGRRRGKRIPRNRGRRDRRGRRGKENNEHKDKEDGDGNDDDGNPPLVGAGTGGMPIDLENVYYWEAKLQYFRGLAVQLIEKEQIWEQETATLRDGRRLAGALMEEWQRQHPEERDLQIWLHLKDRNDLTQEDKLKWYDYQRWAMEHPVYDWEDVVEGIHLWRTISLLLMEEKAPKEGDQGNEERTAGMVGGATETESEFRALDDTKAKLLELQEEWALRLPSVEPESILSRPASFNEASSA